MENTESQEVAAITEAVSELDASMTETANKGLSEETKVNPLEEDLGGLKEAAPEEVAAQLFYLYFPKFEILVNKLSNKALRRLIKALVEYPLNDKPYHHGEIEKNAFLIGDRLLSSKYLMIMHTFAESAEIASTIEKKVEEAENPQDEVIDNKTEN